MLCVVLLLFIAPVVSFLLETSTPKQVIGGGIFLTDEHYNVLMDMLIQERKSRRSLEQYVGQLNQKISSAENEILNTRSEVGILQKTQSQQDLMNMIIGLQHKANVTDDKYDKLLLDHTNLQCELNVTKQKAYELQNEVNELKSLKSVAQMHSVQHLNNVTKHLEQEIQNTHNNINVLESDATARKQDFIALVQDASQMKTELARQTASMLSKIDNFRNFTVGFIDGLRVNMSNEINEKIMNYSLLVNTKQVALTACGYGTYNNGDIVKFSNIIEHQGLDRLNSFTQSGIFTCEMSGTYVFFASLMSSTSDGYFVLYKNSLHKSGAYISGRSGSYESGSGMLVVELIVGDTVSLKCERSNIGIHDYSCFSFFKI